MTERSAPPVARCISSPTANQTKAPSMLPPRLPQSISMPTSMRARTSASVASADTVEGYMTIRAKKPKKLFKMHRPPYFAVCDASQPVLDVFRTEAKAESIYVLSLVGASLSFEADDADMVMEKCFCVNVVTWKKRRTVYFRPQAFICYQEDQLRMLQWVKCIHGAIKNATVQQLRCQLLRSSLDSSTSSEPPGTEDDTTLSMGTSTRSEVDMTCRKRGSCMASRRTGGSNGASNGATANSGSKLRIDTGSTARSPVASSNTSMRSPFSKDPKLLLSAIVSALRSPIGMTKVNDIRADASNANAGNPPAKPASGFHLTKPSIRMKTDEGNVAVTPIDRSHRTSDPSQQARKDPFRGVKCSFFMSKSARQLQSSASKDELCPSCAPDSNVLESSSKSELRSAVECPVSPLPTPDRQVSMWLRRMLLLSAAFVGGILHFSIFLPLAASGLFAHLDDTDADAFVSASVASVSVFTASLVHESLGLTFISIALYVWSYADFKIRQRRRRVIIANRLLIEEQSNFAHIEIPNWLSRPDVDRVEWLNRFLNSAWPCFKIAIRNSLMGCLNPVLEASRPAFISSLSFVRMDLGNKPPHISGVKYIATNSITEEITLDIEVRIVSDDSLVAEVRMAPNLGAAALVTLRDLFLVGTLRIVFHPLCTQWPCFSALRLSFTSRPVFDFSLTAAKINLSNVPFASEWLHAFLHDLLLDYFVWPTVFHVPLWEGSCSVVTAATTSSSSTSTSAAPATTSQH